jgi:hypothetical protein
MCAYALVPNVIEGVSVGSKGWAFMLEFEDDEAVVMSCKVRSVK